jgi:hypothetical protein
MNRFLNNFDLKGPQIISLPGGAHMSRSGPACHVILPWLSILMYHVGVEE